MHHKPRDAYGVARLEANLRMCAVRLKNKYEYENSYPEPGAEEGTNTF